MPETRQALFERIYRDKLWGGRKFFWRRFGSGRRRPTRRGAYLLRCRRWSNRRAHIVVDLLGDFTVDRQFFQLTTATCLQHCASADQHHRRKFAAPNLEFPGLDATTDCFT